MSGHGLEADEEFFSDFLVGGTLHYQAQNLDHPFGQTVRVVYSSFSWLAVPIPFAVISYIPSQRTMLPEVNPPFMYRLYTTLTPFY